ncbi:hypothetical protein scyTo_0023205, partial [Scyliorhinus torazame]|nr:hypothetical protein [Scyliorhinus torazame]
LAMYHVPEWIRIAHLFAVVIRLIWLDSAAHHVTCVSTTVSSLAMARCFTPRLVDPAFSVPAQ